MIKQTKRLIVMAGGTGGHVFPGLEVAHCLMSMGWQVRWLGTADHIEANLVPQHGIDIDFIRIKGLRGQKLKEQLVSPIRIWRAVKQAQRIMRIWHPDVVLGMGGYVSGPGGLAAWICGIPIVLHEQNSIAGLTNRGLAKIACKVLQAFPGAFPKADVVGNPIRNTILSLPKPETYLLYRTGPIRVLIIGGSQGAQIFNKIMPSVAAKLSRTLIFWHQVGKGFLEQVKLSYASKFASKNEMHHQIVEFIDDMAAAYAWADLVICRAGALTVSEIAAVGLPALFVPFMHKDRQQYWNAWPLEQIGAAKIINQSDFNVELVSNILASLDRMTLVTMAKRAREITIPNATYLIAKAISETMRFKPKSILKKL